MIGSVEPTRRLHRQFGDELAFVDVFVRQEHPGGGAAPYRTFADKLADARRYARDFDIGWTVAVDDLEGTVHQRYGGLSNPTYLIDADGRVSFYELVFKESVLARALKELLANQGRGVVSGGLDAALHPPASIRRAWPALAKGSPTSILDLLWVLTVALAPLALGAYFIARPRKPRR
jgi:hypothetical protein